MALSVKRTEDHGRRVRIARGSNRNDRRRDTRIGRTRVEKDECEYEINTITIVARPKAVDAYPFRRVRPVKTAVKTRRTRTAAVSATFRSRTRARESETLKTKKNKKKKQIKYEIRFLPPPRPPPTTNDVPVARTNARALGDFWQVLAVRLPSYVADGTDASDRAGVPCAVPDVFTPARGERSRKLIFPKAAWGRQRDRKQTLSPEIDHATITTVRITVTMVLCRSPVLRDTVFVRHVVRRGSERPAGALGSRPNRCRVSPCPASLV